jgi:hypothetical protein
VAYAQLPRRNVTRREEKLQERVLNRVRNEVDLQQREGAARVVLGALEEGSNHVRHRRVVAPEYFKWLRRPPVVDV